MKKILFLICALAILLPMSLWAQTITLTFTGKDAKNQHVQLNRVVITNLTQNWQETIYYPDTILMLGSTGMEDFETGNEFKLSQNVPNPFDGTTDFALQMPEAGKVMLTVYDLNGKKITAYQGKLAIGVHTFRVLLNTTQSYLLTARCGSETATIKMVNNGNAGENAIRYVGESKLYPLTMQLKNGTKGQTDKPFAFGDNMMYIGYATINGKEYTSQTIEKRQVLSETFILDFETTAFQLPTVTTAAISDITSNSALCSGTVATDGGTNVIVRGVCWNTSQNPTIANNHTTDGSGTGSFTSSLAGLTANTTYYVRAYATNSVGTAYGNEVSFTTLTTSLKLPVAITNEVSEVYTNIAICGGTVIDMGTYVTARGICFGTSHNPTIAGDHTADGTGAGTFTSLLSNLQELTTYYVRAYATNSDGTAYGEERSFTTCGGQPCAKNPIVTDIEGNIYNTVQIGNQCWMKENLRTTKYADGTSITYGETPSSVMAQYFYPASNIKQNGLFYNWKAVMHNSSSSSANPSGVQGICPNGWHVPSDAEWTQLTDYVGVQNDFVCGSNNTYIAKALASNTSRWLSSTSSCDVGNVPICNNNTGFSAVPAGYNGGQDVIGLVVSNAIFWSSTATDNQSYYRQLYHNSPKVLRSTASIGAGYSVRCLRNEESSNIQLPTVITTNVSNVTESTAYSGGTVISDGGAVVTARGVLWTVEQTPSIRKMMLTRTGWKLARGTITPAFETSSGEKISDLMDYLYFCEKDDEIFFDANGTERIQTNVRCAAGEGVQEPEVVTRWHVDDGLDYLYMQLPFFYEYDNQGNMVGLDKAEEKCEILYVDASQLQLSYTFQANMTRYTFTMVYLSTTSNEPTISTTSTYTIDGSGTGSFTSSLTGLAANTTYYVRAYATNCMGTAFGEEVTFTTSMGGTSQNGQPCSNAATVIDYDGNIYNTVQIGNQCWMKENLRTTKYANGTDILQGTITSTTTAYWYYPNNNVSNVATYGLLYNWPAVMNGSTSSNANPSGVQGICPTGWHVPSDAEWTQLTDYVGGRSEYQCGSNSKNIAKALASTTGWNTSTFTCAVGNTQSNNNSTFFSSVPTGLYSGGSYVRFCGCSYLWSATEYNSGNAYYRLLDYNSAVVIRDDGSGKSNGFSVRCLRN